MAAITLIGNVNVDLIVRPARDLPPPGVERNVDAIEIRAGGAAAIAGLTLAALGGSPRVVAAVGDDRFGRLLLEELQDAGLSVRDVSVLPDTPSGVSIAFEAPDRDRSFLTSLGSLGAFELVHVPDDALGADAVFVGGYFLTPRLRGGPVAEILRRARDLGATTLLDTGWDPDGWPPATRTEVLELLDLVDVFLPNADEACALAETSDPRAAAEMLAAGSGRRVAVKLGAQGCVAIDADGTVLEVRAPNVEALDTTGAGDAFDAGLIAAMLEGGPFGAALGFATRVGSSVVGRPTSSRYPSRDELLG